MRWKSCSPCLDVWRRVVIFVTMCTVKRTEGDEMKKQRMDGASVRDVKYENAGKVTIYLVDQDIDVRKDST